MTSFQTVFGEEWEATLRHEERKRDFDDDDEEGDDFDVYDHDDDDDTDDDDDDDDGVTSRLSWRFDPRKNFSDWTVRVTRKCSWTSTSQSTAPLDAESVYHVHRCVVAIGPRRSRFLSELLRATPPSSCCRCSCSSVSETTASETPQEELATPSSSYRHEIQSELELVDLAADAFPILLDYMYDETAIDFPSPSSYGPAINTENAVGLWYLADYLDVPSLACKCRRFVKKDLSMQTLHLYASQATRLGREQMVSTVRDYAADNICKITPSSPFLKVAPPYLMEEVLMQVQQRRGVHQHKKHRQDGMNDGGQEEKKEGDEGQARSDSTLMRLLRAVRNVSNTMKSPKLSCLVASYVAQHRTDGLVGPDQFRRLTGGALLPVVDYSAARVLIELEEDIVGTEKHEITDLKRRCFDAIKTTCTTRDLLPNQISQVARQSCHDNGGDGTGNSGESDSYGGDRSNLYQFILDYPAEIGLDIMSEAYRRDHEEKKRELILFFREKQRRLEGQLEEARRELRARREEDDEAGREGQELEEEQEDIREGESFDATVWRPRARQYR